MSSRRHFGPCAIFPACGAAGATASSGAKPDVGSTRLVGPPRWIGFERLSPVDVVRPEVWLLSRSEDGQTPKRISSPKTPWPRSAESTGCAGPWDVRATGRFTAPGRCRSTRQNRQLRIFPRTKRSSPSPRMMVTRAKPTT